MSDNVIRSIFKGLISNSGAAFFGALGGAVTAFLASIILGISNQVLIVAVFVFFMLGGALMKVFPDGIDGED
jgi:hypothetical protein